MKHALVAHRELEQVRGNTDETGFWGYVYELCEMDGQHRRLHAVLSAQLRDVLDLPVVLTHKCRASQVLLASAKERLVWTLPRS